MQMVPTCFYHCSCTVKTPSSSILRRETGQRISGNAALNTMRFSAVTRLSRTPSDVTHEAEWSAEVPPLGTSSTIPDYTCSFFVISVV